MEVNEINQKLALAKANLNSVKGRADGMLYDGVIQFQAEVLKIIDAQIVEIVELKAKLERKASEVNGQ